MAEILKILRNDNGSIIKIPGTLKDVKAVGWYIDEYKAAQVSINLINYKNTPLHIVFEEVRKQANNRGLRVTGSEIVGLVPKKAILDAGIFYLKKQNSSFAIPESDILNIAVSSLGLNEFSDFDVNLKIIENCINNQPHPLLRMSLDSFTDELSRNSVAPGGGSVSSLVGSLSVSLISMVCNITLENKKYKKQRNKMHNIALKMQKFNSELKIIIDDDTKAFNMIIDSLRMPKKTKKQINVRKKALKEATINAIETPYKILKIVDRCIVDINYVVKYSNPNCLSDLGVAIANFKSAAYGSLLNVHINLKDLDKSSYSNKIANISKDKFKKIEKECDFVISMINSKVING